MKNFKDKLSNVCGLIALVAGSLLALPAAGIALPAAVITGATIGLTVAGSVVAWLTGKTSDGKPKE
jgi:hypothetical protein